MLMKINIMRVLGSLVLVLYAMSVGVAAQAGRSAEAAKIDKYCSRVDLLKKKLKRPSLIFADTADMNDDTPKWRSFASEKALELFRKKTETYTIAYNWSSGGKIVASNFTMFSGSGDWVLYLYHWFRDDGSLARVETDFRTFNGDFKVLRKRYFDPAGKLITQSVKILDLKSGKPKIAADGVMGDDEDEEDFYKSTSTLPFAHLLKK